MAFSARPRAGPRSGPIAPSPGASGCHSPARGPGRSGWTASLLVSVSERRARPQPFRLDRPPFGLHSPARGSNRSRVDRPPLCSFARSDACEGPTGPGGPVPPLLFRALRRVRCSKWSGWTGDFALIIRERGPKRSGWTASLLISVSQVRARPQPVRVVRFPTGLLSSARGSNRSGWTGLPPFALSRAQTRARLLTVRVDRPSSVILRAPKRARGPNRSGWTGPLLACAPTRARLQPVRVDRPPPLLFRALRRVLCDFALSEACARPQTRSCAPTRARLQTVRVDRPSSVLSRSCSASEAPNGPGGPALLCDFRLSDAREARSGWTGCPCGFKRSSGARIQPVRVDRTPPPPLLFRALRRVRGSKRSGWTGPPL